MVEFYLKKDGERITNRDEAMDILDTVRLDFFYKGNDTGKFVIQLIELAPNNLGLEIEIVEPETDDQDGFEASQSEYLDHLAEKTWHEYLADMEAEETDLGLPGDNDMAIVHHHAGGDVATPHKSITNEEIPF